MIPQDLAERWLQADFGTPWKERLQEAVARLQVAGAEEVRGGGASAAPVAAGLFLCGQNIANADSAEEGLSIDNDRTASNILMKSGLSQDQTSRIKLHT